MLTFLLFVCALGVALTLSLASPAFATPYPRLLMCSPLLPPRVYLSVSHRLRKTRQAAFKVLEKMGSVTAFSVANSVKRGVVVLAGAVAMGTPMGFLPALGATVAVLGTAAYWVSE